MDGGLAALSMFWAREKIPRQFSASVGKVSRTWICPLAAAGRHHDPSLRRHVAGAAEI